MSSLSSSTTRRTTYYQFLMHVVISGCSSDTLTESCLHYCNAILCRSDALWEVVLLSRGCNLQNSISRKLQSERASKRRGRVSSVTRSCHAWVSKRKGNMLDHGEGRYAASTGGSGSINIMEEGSSSGLSVSCCWCLFYGTVCCGASAPVLIWGYLLSLP